MFRSHFLSISRLLALSVLTNWFPSIWIQNGAYVYVLSLCPIRIENSDFQYHANIRLQFRIRVFLFLLLSLSPVHFCCLYFIFVQFCLPKKTRGCCFSDFSFLHSSFNSLSLSATPFLSLSLCLCQIDSINCWILLYTAKQCAQAQHIRHFVCVCVFACALCIHYIYAYNIFICTSNFEANTFHIFKAVATKLKGKKRNNTTGKLNAMRWWKEKGEEADNVNNDNGTMWFRIMCMFSVCVRVLVFLVHHYYYCCH